MEYLSESLPIIIYILLIVLIILLIVISVKVIKAMDTVQGIVDDVDDKVQSLNGFFHIIDTATDKIALISDRMIDIITGILHKVFKPKRKSKKKEEELENE